MVFSLNMTMTTSFQWITIIYLLLLLCFISCSGKIIYSHLSQATKKWIVNGEKERRKKLYAPARISVLQKSLIHNLIIKFVKIFSFSRLLFKIKEKYKKMVYECVFNEFQHLFKIKNAFFHIFGWNGCTRMREKKNFVSVKKKKKIV